MTTLPLLVLAALSLITAVAKVVHIIRNTNHLWPVRIIVVLSTLYLSGLCLALAEGWVGRDERVVIYFLPALVGLLMAEIAHAVVEW